MSTQHGCEFFLTFEAKNIIFVRAFLPAQLGLLHSICWQFGVRNGNDACLCDYLKSSAAVTLGMLCAIQSAHKSFS